MGRYGFSPAHLLKVQKMPTFLGEEVHWRNALHSPNQWARKHLRSGDLAVLFRISKREWADADPDQIKRLMRRSFVKKEADDSLRPTAKGRLALLIKRLSGS